MPRSRREARAALRCPPAVELSDDPQRAIGADARFVRAVARELHVQVNLVRPGGDYVLEVPRAMVPLPACARVEVLQIAVRLLPHLHFPAGEAVVREVQRRDERLLVPRVERGDVVFEDRHRGAYCGFVTGLSRHTATLYRASFSSSRTIPSPGPDGKDMLPRLISSRVVATVSTTFNGPTHSSPGTTLREVAPSMISAVVLRSSPKPCPRTTGRPAASAVASMRAACKKPPACLMPNFTKSAQSALITRIRLS